MYNAYLRGYEGKSPTKYPKGSLVDKEYKKGKSDREKGLPNRYIKNTDNMGIIDRKAKKWGIEDAPERKTSLKTVGDNIAHEAGGNIGQGEKTQGNEKNKPRGGV